MRILLLSTLLLSFPAMYAGRSSEGNAGVQAPSVVAVPDAAQFDLLLKEHALVVADFYRDSCPPCRTLAPIFQQLAQSFPQIQFVKVNIDYVDTLARRYKIFSIPTIIFFKHGSEAERILGLNEAKLRSGLERVSR